MTGRKFHRLGDRNGVGIAPGGDRNGWFGGQRRRAEDRAPWRSRRSGGSGSDPRGRQAASGAGATGNRRGPEPEPCDPSAAMPNPRRRVSREGLPTPPDRDPVRLGDGSAAALSLYRLRRSGGWDQLASALPLNP